MNKQKIRIVAIDDEPAFAEMLGIYLSEFGDFEISTYTSPDEALDHIITGNVDAVISDYLMEDMDGIELVKLVKSKVSEIPFVMLTGMDDKEVIFQATNAGVDFIQFKSEDPDRLFPEIAQKITNAVETHRARKALVEGSRIREIMMRAQRDLMGKLSGALTQTDAMDSSLTTIRFLTGCTIGSIHLIDKKTKRIKLAISHNLPNEKLKRFTFGDIHQVIYSEQSKYFLHGDEVKHDSDSLISGGQIPILAGGKAIGALTFIFEHPRRIDPEIKDTIEILSSQLGNTLIRIESEELVRHRQEELTELYSVMEELVIVIDMDGTILNINPTTSRVLGYQEEELVGMPIQVLYPSEIRDEILLQFLDLTGNGGKIRNTYPFIDRNGDLIPVETRGTVGVWGGKNVLFCVCREISERIKAEKNLHESYERIKAILATSTAQIYMKDIELKYLHANQPFCDFVKVKPDSLPGKTDQDLFIQDIAIKRSESDRSVITTDTPVYNLEEEILLDDGSGIWLVTSKIPIHNQDGEVSGVVGTSLDITDLIKTKKELEKRDRVLSAVSTIAQGLVRGDDWEPIIPECIELLGRAIGVEIAFLGTFSKVDGEYTCTLFNEWRDPDLSIHCKTGEMIYRCNNPEIINSLTQIPFLQFNGEEENQRKISGSVFPEFSYEFYLPVFAFKHLWGVLGFVSCKKREKLSLAEIESLLMASELIGSAISRYYTEELFHKPVERSLVGIYLIQNEKFIYINPRMSEILGYSREKFDNSYYLSYIHPEDVDLVLEKYKQVIQTPESSDDFEMRVITADGRTIIVENLISRFLYQGKPAMIGSIMDITNRKQAEEGLRHSLREKDILLREVHHRVKNNMQIIVSMLRIQSSMLENPEVIEILKESKNRILSMAIIHEKLYRTENLVSINLLEYISSLANTMISDFSPVESLISLELVCDPSIEMTIDAGIPLGLILNELLTNSFKHGFSSGETGSIEISIFPLDSGIIEITYHDSGKGLPPEFDIETSESLGMQIISNLVFQASGEISMYNDNGTIVKLKIPMSEGFIIGGDDDAPRE